MEHPVTHADAQQSSAAAAALFQFIPEKRYISNPLSDHMNLHSTKLRNANSV
jgi:hypothetical protein